MIMIIWSMIIIWNWLFDNDLIMLICNFRTLIILTYLIIILTYLTNLIYLTYWSCDILSIILFDDPGRYLPDGKQHGPLLAACGTSSKCITGKFAPGSALQRWSRCSPRGRREWGGRWTFGANILNFAARSLWRSGCAARRVHDEFCLLLVRRVAPRAERIRVH